MPEDQMVEHTMLPALDPIPDNKTVSCPIESRLSENETIGAIRIREAVPTQAEVERVATLGRRVFGETFAPTTSLEDLNYYLDRAYSPLAIEADIRNPQKRILIAECNVGTFTGTDSDYSDRSLAGFAMIALDSTEDCVTGLERPVELQRLYIDSQYQGSGLARKLEERVVRWATEAGYKTIWLGVWEHNNRAKRFYGKCGYERIGVHDFVVGKQVDVDEIMAKKL
jgi:GNAT superfamily N-acetyltransferase